MILIPDGPRGNGNERPQTFQGTGSSENHPRAETVMAGKSSLRCLYIVNQIDDEKKESDQ